MPSPRTVNAGPRGAASSWSRTTTRPSRSTTYAQYHARSARRVSRTKPATPSRCAKSNAHHSDQPGTFPDACGLSSRSFTRVGYRLGSAPEELAHLVALLDELLRGDRDLRLRELVVLDALDDRPAGSVAAHGEAELQPSRHAVLTAAHDCERVPVAGGGRLPDAVHRVDRRVRGRRGGRLPPLVDDRGATL